MPVQVVGLGAGGHAKVVIEILRLEGEYQLVGLLDPKPDLRNELIACVPVMGGDEQLSKLKERGVEFFFVGLGSVSDMKPRRRLYEFALDQGLQPVAAIHPSAVVSASATLGMGPTIMATAVINASARLGDNVIINTGAIVEHDCVVGNHVHIATGARLSGGVIVGDETHIGAGAVVRHCMRIGTGSLVGAGAVVVEDVPDGQIVVGNPARLWERGLDGEH